MKLAEITVDDFGGAPIAEHNMPCGICLKNHAVYMLHEGHFIPCWECQKIGWATVKIKKSFIRKILFALGEWY